MGRKSHRKTRAHADRKGKQPVLRKARQVLDGLLIEARIERMEQADILQDLLRKHHGEIPVPKLWGLRARRLQPVRIP